MANDNRGHGTGRDGRGRAEGPNSGAACVLTRGANVCLCTIAPRRTTRADPLVHTLIGLLICHAHHSLRSLPPPLLLQVGLTFDQPCVAELLGSALAERVALTSAHAA